MKDYLHQENYIRQLQSDLGHLKKKWSQKYPRRISGGVAAVAGFHYQFLTYLLESVNAWLGLEYEKDKPQVFTECISDIISSHKQNVVLITQVKITQSSKHIRDALSELWEINKLALEETPDLVKRLQFRILSARKGLKNVRRSIENWRPSHAELGDKELKDFQTRTQADIFSYPEDELLSLLANKLKARRPRETIQRWLGYLLRAGDKNNFESEAKNIWNELHGLLVAGMDQQKPAAIYIWTYADRPPDLLAKGNVLTGSQPIIDNLRNGSFAPRDELYNTIGDRIVNWIENNPVAVEDFIKSVLEAEAYVKDHPIEAKKFVKNRFNYESDFIDYSWSKQEFVVILGQAMLITFEDQARWRIKHRLTEATEVPNYLDYTYLDALEKVKPEAVGIIH